jgi:glycosyltransferase involved in cell wall biosynthesis
VSYVGNLRLGLEHLGITTHVVTSHQVAGGAHDPAVDLSELRVPRARRALLDLMAKIPRLHSLGRARGWAVALAANEIRSRHGLDMLEMEETFGAAWYAQQVLDVPVVVRLHGPRFLNGAALGLPVDDEFRRIDRAEGRCIGQATGVTAPSRDVLDRVRSRYGLALANARVIPNPVPLVPPERRWSLESCDRRSILFVGRFDRHKGGDLVIDAFREVAAASPQAELIFVGPDRGLRHGAGQVRDLPGYVAERLPPDVRARAHFLGPLDADRIEVLRRQAFVTVVASRYEIFGLTLAESLSFGCPTVAADTGGIPEVLLADQTGLLFASGDASDLAAKILTLFRHPQRAAAFAAAAAAGARRLAPDAVAEATIDYYETLPDGPLAKPRHEPGRLLYALSGLPRKS